MFIVSGDRELIINTDHAKVIYRNDDEIRVVLGEDYDSFWTLGEYNDEEETKEVFKQLMDFLKNAYVRDFFYMPPSDEEDD